MENMAQGLLATVIGISIVMVVLLLLSFVLDLLKLLSVKPPEEKTIAITADDTKKKTTDNLEIVAVITAALAAHLNVSPDGLVVRSVHKVAAWNDAVRREQQRKFY